MKLEDLAEILRFQDRREAAREGDDPDLDLVYGEAKPDDFDQTTGFLIPGGMSRVGLFRSPKKYALRRWDILMFFNGAPEKIGLTSLVIDEVRAIPARVLCIIRPYAVNAAGLYLYLRTETIRSEIMSLARRNKFDNKAFINLESLRRYEIGTIFVNAMEEAGDRARELIEFYRESRKQEQDMMYEIQKALLNAWPEE